MFKGFYNLTSGMLSQERRLDIVANNMTNTATAGYKTDRYTDSTFEEYLVSRIDQGRTSTQLGGESYILAPIRTWPFFATGTNRLEPTCTMPSVLTKSKTPTGISASGSVTSMGAPWLLNTKRPSPSDR